MSNLKDLNTKEKFLSERQILQAAMGYCGTWYDSYDSPLASDIPFNTKPI